VKNEIFAGLKQYKMDSVIGSLYLVGSESALHGLYWKKQSSIRMTEFPTGEIAKTVQQVNEYLSKKRIQFDLKLSVAGTEFQKQVWSELRKIPYGKTLSYADVARKIKNDKAVRAVGTANGKNPISIIVPCHRVINKSGSMGGYAGGLVNKNHLLELEKKNLK
jgi:methylated-DNA-[protein]-cysteine S-methyltransferase